MGLFGPKISAEEKAYLKANEAAWKATMSAKKFDNKMEAVNAAVKAGNAVNDGWQIYLLLSVLHSQGVLMEIDEAAYEADKAAALERSSGKSRTFLENFYKYYEMPSGSNRVQFYFTDEMEPETIRFRQIVTAVVLAYSPEMKDVIDCKILFELFHIFPEGTLFKASKATMECYKIRDALLEYQNIVDSYPSKNRDFIVGCYNKIIKAGNAYIQTTNRAVDRVKKSEDKKSEVIDHQDVTDISRILANVLLLYGYNPFVDQGLLQKGLNSMVSAMYGDPSYPALSAYLCFLDIPQYKEILSQYIPRAVKKAQYAMDEGVCSEYLANWAFDHMTSEQAAAQRIANIDNAQAVADEALYGNNSSEN